MMLQPRSGRIDGTHYLESTPETVLWGRLPNRKSQPVLTVDAGAVVTVDTVSHEGILEDQGRDPVTFFGRHGVAEPEVLRDARAIAESDLVHSFGDDGPHVVTGPVEVRSALPGDLLKVDVLSLGRRVEYGVVSNRHGFGALPGEFPEGPPPLPGASAANHEAYRTVSTFCAVERRNGRYYGCIPYGDADMARFPLAPFMGIMGVATDTDEALSSVPPGRHGGNIDVKVLTSGSSLYLPVQVAGALFYAGDPHYAQGNGEVALTALEAPLRATFRLSVLRGPEAERAVGLLAGPFGETGRHWVPIGLHEDLGEAMKAAVRAAVTFLSTRVGMDRAAAYAYLSAAADFEVSQVVDRVQGVHCLIRKSDFPAIG